MNPSRCRLVWTSVAAALMLSRSFSPQERILTFERDSWGEVYPIPPRLDLLEDRDGDGLGELLVGDYIFHDSTPPPPRFGRVSVISSRTGLELAAYSEPHNNGVGMAAVVLGDLDEDGMLDFGSASWDVPGGGAWVWSGRDLSVIFRDPDSKVGIGPIGDVDGDQVPDFAYAGGTPARVISGRTLEELYLAHADAGRAVFGWRIVSLGDVDGDGVPDFAVSAPDLVLPAFPSCRQAWIYVYSGADGHLLYRIAGQPPCDLLGIGMAAPGDVNGDGVGDLAASAGFASILFFDGRNGALLGKVDREGQCCLFGYALESVGDVNANGFGDLLVYAALNPTLPPPDNFAGPGEAWLIDGGTRKRLYRITDPRSVSGPPYLYGRAFTACGDWNGDAQPDLAIAAVSLASESVSGIDIFSGHPFGVRSVPEPCPRPADDVRIGSSGVPVVGRDYPIHLTGVSPGLRAWLLVGTRMLAPARSRLGALGPGGGGCAVRVRPDLVIACTTVPAGGKESAATAIWKIPSDAALVGTRTYAQWLLPDSGVASRTSRVLDITIQASEPQPYVP